MRKKGTKAAVLEQGPSGNRPIKPNPEGKKTQADTVISQKRRKTQPVQKREGKVPGLSNGWIRGGAAAFSRQESNAKRKGIGISL